MKIWHSSNTASQRNIHHLYNKSFMISQKCYHRDILRLGNYDLMNNLKLSNQFWINVFYFVTENLELSCWIVFWVSLLLLILMGCSNTLLVRGVSIDAEEPDGKCVVFPCYYLRTIFQEDKLKKIHLSGLAHDEKVYNMSEKPVRNNYIPTISITIT